jgi:hypothetical protein
VIVQVRGYLLEALRLGDLLQVEMPDGVMIAEVLDDCIECELRSSVESLYDWTFN